MLYLELLASLVHWFESRGENESHARYAASIAVSVLVAMNVVTITLFAHGLTGARWFRIFQSVPLNILSIFALVALHWWLIGRIKKGDERRNYARRLVPIWLVYLITSVIFLFIGVLISTR
jgi:hypothetical protein